MYVMLFLLGTVRYYIIIIDDNELYIIMYAPVSTNSIDRTVSIIIARTHGVRFNDNNVFLIIVLDIRPNEIAYMHAERLFYFCLCISLESTYVPRRFRVFLFIS